LIGNHYCVDTQIQILREWRFSAPEDEMFNTFMAKLPNAPKTLSPKSAHELCRKGEICLVDVREASEWAQMRVQGAIHMPLSSLESQLANLPKNKPVVFYCLAGKRSQKALDVCRSQGLPHDTQIEGGIAAWHAAGREIRHHSGQ
jgi:rhodanese-related sulfurtransferase